MKLLCAQVLKDLLGEGIDVSYNNNIVCSFTQFDFTRTEPLSPLFLQYDKIAKLTADAKFGKSSSDRCFMVQGKSTTFTVAIKVGSPWVKKKVSHDRL